MQHGNLQEPELKKVRSSHVLEVTCAYCKCYVTFTLVRCEYIGNSLKEALIHLYSDNLLCIMYGVNAMSEKEKMLLGMLYDANYDSELISDRARSKDICHTFSQLLPSNSARQKELIESLLGCLNLPRLKSRDSCFNENCFAASCDASSEVLYSLHKRNFGLSQPYIVF